VTAFVVRRLVRLAVVVIGVSLVTFAILHASGDPVALIMPEAPEADRVVDLAKLAPDGTNANATTSQRETDMGGGPVLYDNLVEVALAD